MDTAIVRSTLIAAGPGSQRVGVQPVERDQLVGDDSAAYQVFLNDSLERGRIARAVPRSLGVDDRNRSALTDSQTVRLGSENAALFGKAELFQSSLEKLPCSHATLFLATLGRRLVAAQEDVTPGERNSDADCRALLRVSGTHGFTGGKVVGGVNDGDRCYDE